MKFRRVHDDKEVTMTLTIHKDSTVSMEVTTKARIQVRILGIWFTYKTYFIKQRS